MKYSFACFGASCGLLLAACAPENTPDIRHIVHYGETWHLHADASNIVESREAFLNNRMDLRVKFPDGSSRVIPGYLSKSEDKDGLGFHANLVIDQLGDYEIEIARCSGEKIAIRSRPCDETAIVNRDRWTAKDRDRSILPPISALTQGEHRYLIQNGKPFLKSGAGSPENILAYADFDGTYDAGGTPFPSLGKDQLHSFEPHLRDARSDDPTWDDGKGAALLGLFNYYEQVGVNSQYLVGMNIHGDGWDVSPWVSHDDPYVFDVSKLAQWQTVFEHANNRGVAIHFLFTETENESFFEVYDGLTVGEDFAPSRKLYYREIVARFGHLPMIIWNLGEENGVIGNTGEDPYRQPTSPEQRGEFADYIASLDSRGHPIVSHNWPDAEEALYGPLLGRPSFSGISLQAHDNYFDKIVEWTGKSAAAGRPWMVSVDEPLGWEFGARPDADVERREEILTVLWPTLMAGGAGVEWYFGWQNNAPTSDLSNEDQRSRDALWKVSAKVRRFFETLPLLEMTVRRDGDAIIFEGAGHRLEMMGETVTYTAPNEVPRALDPFNPF